MPNRQANGNSQRVTMPVPEFCCSLLCSTTLGLGCLVLSEVSREPPFRQYLFSKVGVKRLAPGQRIPHQTPHEQLIEPERSM